MIGWFADLALGDRPTVGGKGASLGELTRAGIAVPPGFVLRTRAFEDFLAGLEEASTIRPEVGGLEPDDLDTIGICSARVRARIEAAQMPSALRAELGAAWETLTDGGRTPV